MFFALYQDSLRSSEKELMVGVINFHGWFVGSTMVTCSQRNEIAPASIRGADVTVKKFPQQSRLFHSKRYNFI
jgi:hypothetical protein